MKATLYDGNGKPTGYIQYQTPFEMFWKGVGYLLLVLLIGLVFLIGISGIFSGISQQQSAQREAAERQAEAQHETVQREKLVTKFHEQGFHLYAVEYTIVYDAGGQTSENCNNFVLATSTAEAYQHKANSFALTREHDTIRISSVEELSENEALDECIWHLRCGIAFCGNDLIGFELIQSMAS